MINFAKYSLLAYLLLKPFYIFSSGGLQIADAFLLLAFALLVAGSWHIPAKHKLLAEAIQSNRLFVIFVACTIIINSLYFFVYPEFKFLLSSLYFVFNLVAIVLFAIFFKDKVFLARVGSIFKLNLLLQLALWVLHLGRIYGDDRYMGTFNDPNQFGYYIILSFFFIYIIDTILKKKHTYIYYILAFFLILQSGSTGMLLGIGVFSILFTIQAIAKQLASPARLLRRVMHSFAIVAILAVPLAIIGFALSGFISGIAPSTEESTIFARLDEKTERASGDADTSILGDRNLDILIEYPHLILYGAGEGALDRFERATYPGSEVHSTFPSILFYYGIIPFFVLVAWIVSRLRNVRWDIMVVYLSLFAVSFVLLNQRQTLFWALIVLAAFTVIYTNKNKPVVEPSGKRKS